MLCLGSMPCCKQLCSHITLQFQKVMFTDTRDIVNLLNVSFHLVELCLHRQNTITPNLGAFSLENLPLHRANIMLSHQGAQFPKPQTQFPRQFPTFL